MRRVSGTRPTPSYPSTPPAGGFGRDQHAAFHRQRDTAPLQVGQNPRERNVGGKLRIGRVELENLDVAGHRTPWRIGAEKVGVVRWPLHAIEWAQNRIRRREPDLR